MATANTPLPAMNGAPQALSYQQAMQGLNTMVEALPSPSGSVAAQPGTWTTVNVRAGQHYKVQRLSKDGRTLETPDDLVAVRNGDALHLRYADGSTLNFEGFFSTCTDASICSVNVAGDAEGGMTLSAEFPSGGVADDGLLVYAHGSPDVLMAMAEGQPALISAFLAMDGLSTMTYLAPDISVAALALGALGVAGLASQSSSGVYQPGGNGATSPLTPQQAIDALSAAAERNTASDSSTGASVYAAAGVSGVTAANVAAINSALNSSFVNGVLADTSAEVQSIVDAYKSIIASADGRGGNTTTALTGTQYTTVGVTGISGTATPGSVLTLLNSAIDEKITSAVDSVTEVQAVADAATRLLAAAGGSAADATALTLEDLQNLSVGGVTTANLDDIRTAIRNTTPDSAIDTAAEVQTVVNLQLGALGSALNTIAAAAQANNATSTLTDPALFATAGVTGVGAGNLGKITDALDTTIIDGSSANTTAKVQTIVDGYNAIIASADGTPNNTTAPLTGAQYTAIGVQGISGTATRGTALYLLDNVVDGKPLTGVDTVLEVQALADAANHVMAAAGGSAPQIADLSRADFANLGISGVTDSNLSAVQAAIGAATSDALVDTLASLQTFVTTAISAIPAPRITSLLGGVTNLDVSSNLVLSADQSITVGTGSIRITDLGGTTAGGYHSDTSTNTQTIDVATAVASGFLTISGTGASTKIIINPQWDLDLSSNYQITFDNGTFLAANGAQAPVAIAAMNFSTIKPGVHGSATAATEAVASQTMSDTTGALGAGKSWIDIQGLSNNTGSLIQLGDLSGGSFALVMKNYATVPGGAEPQGDTSNGIATLDTNVSVLNFGNNDIVYFDSQTNDSTQVFAVDYTQLADGGPSADGSSGLGGVAGQNALILGLVSSPMQQGSTANVLLGLEGNTTNKIYAAVFTQSANALGWANDWHATSAPLIMG